MYLIAEIHNQYGGDLGVAEQMILQAKMSGAHAVKIQLYDPAKRAMPGDDRRGYLELSFKETQRLKLFAEQLRIDFFASFFDEGRFDWCLELDFPVLKIASPVLVSHPDLVRRAVETGRRTIISLGFYDWKSRPLPFTAPNVEYLYCVSKYPATLEDLEMPDFQGSFFAGYSDHTIGVDACLYALARGARVLEKHFTLSPALQKSTELAHAGSMTAADLERIRTFGEAMQILQRCGPAYEKQGVTAEARTE